PESWNGSWTNAASTSVECGKGMAMKIEERPAFLCRGKANDSVSNPNCYKEVDSNGDISCRAYAPECYDNSPGNNGSYCPIEECQVADSSSNTNCDDLNSTQCASCYSKKTSNASQNPYLALQLNQCYNLENYKGRVSNIN